MGLFLLIVVPIIIILIIEKISQIFAEIKVSNQKNYLQKLEEIREKQRIQKEKMKNPVYRLVHSDIFIGVCIVSVCLFLIFFRIYSYSQDSQSFSDVKSSELCVYQSCNNNREENSRYCYRHLCSVDGCKSVGTSSTSFQYCKHHEAELTCAEPGCYKPKYFHVGSNYCQVHYLND